MSIPSRKRERALDADTSVSAEGAVLAGGRSTRMGEDKARLLLSGTPFVERVVSALRPLAGPVRMVGGDPSLANELRIPHQPDLLPGRGPLSGLHAAIATASRQLVLVVACDFPLVSTRFLAELLRLAYDDQWDAVVPRVDRAIPVCAVYRCRPHVCETFENRLSSNVLSATGALEELSVRWLDRHEIEALDPGARSLTNVNTPAEYERLSNSYSSRE